MKVLEILNQLVEDMVDGLFCLMRRNQPTILFEEVIAKLKRDGKLMDH